MADVAPVVFKKRAGKNVNLKKRPATPPAESDSEYSSEEEGVRVKRRRKGGLTSALATKGPHDLSKNTAFAADRSTNITQTDDATRQSNWYENDAADPSRRTASITASTTADNGPSDTYKGAASYSNFIQKNPNKEQKSVGPVKAATNIRTITVTDFAPDVCKDYKQTGFCGFGDSCKFLHAREDYKQGWQLDKEWENVTKGKKSKEPHKLENIPFACIICKEPYKNPVVTKCGHYFCEGCALARYKQKGGKACAACGADTGGTFKMAKNLRKLLDKKRERVRLRREKAREEGLEVSSDEE
ncbi:RNA-splicing factor [Taxawa tesnikishii (nom. ined.)]|nr:RNA-splicing factor [Dothideales sp. JES 119]